MEPGSRLRTVYGLDEIRVVSDHDQAARQVGAGLRVSARAPDAIIEAVEAVDEDWFCIGVQWQPTSARDLRLCEFLVRACRAPFASVALAA
jgi:putative glutamine amidotransferase